MYSYELLKVEAIVEDPTVSPRIRVKENHVKRLAEDVKKRGILVPILVVPVDGKYVIYDGKHRLRAAKIAGLTVIPAIVKRLSPTEALIESIKVNTISETLEESDLGYAAAMLVSVHEVPAEQVAVLLGKTGEWVKERARTYGKLTEPVKEMLLRGELHFKQAVQIAKLPPEKQEKVASKVVGESVRATEDVVRSELGLPPKPKPEAKKAEEAEEAPSLRGRLESLSRERDELIVKLKEQSEALAELPKLKSELDKARLTVNELSRKLEELKAERDGLAKEVEKLKKLRAAPSLEAAAKWLALELLRDEGVIALGSTPLLGVKQAPPEAYEPLRQVGQTLKAGGEVVVDPSLKKALMERLKERGCTEYLVRVEYGSPGERVLRALEAANLIVRRGETYFLK